MPIGIALALLAPRLLVESRSDSADRSFDIPGAIAVTGGLAMLVDGTVEAVNAGWGSSKTIIRLAIAAVLLISFVIIELRARKPLMPFAIFRLRTLRGANIVGLLIGMCLFSMFFFISLYLQDVMHYSPIKTGLAYLPMTGGIMLTAGAASPIVNRIGFKAPLVAGLLLMGGGLIWFSRIPATGGSYASDVLGPSLIAAVGLGLTFVTITIAAVTGTRSHQAGLASGLINTSQQVGGALGLAVLATIANTRTKDVLHSGAAHTAAEALTKGFERAFLVGGGFALAGAVLAVGLISAKESRQNVLAVDHGEPAVSEA